MDFHYQKGAVMYTVCQPAKNKPRAESANKEMLWA